MSIEDMMEKCPLKQEIRDKLWKKYITNNFSKPIKYLTLYCPPLMDVKYFHQQNIIELENDIFKNTVGITNDGISYGKAVSSTQARLEYLNYGELNKLIKKRNKDFLSRFPFDVINLDYCNHIHGEISRQFLSSNEEDIEKVFEYQKINNSEKFVLFLTTRTDNVTSNRTGFSDDFLSRLKNNVNINIDKVEKYKRSFKELYNDDSVEKIKNNSFDEFITFGIVKLISMTLASNNFKIIDCDVYWLTRNFKKPARDLLHIAFSIEKGKHQVARKMGNYYSLESGAKIILDKIKSKKILFLNEEDHYEHLLSIHGKQLSELSKKTSEIPIPEPKNNEKK